MGTEMLVLTIVAVALVLFGVFAMVTRFYRQVDQGRALIINTMGKEPVVTFTGGIVIPIVNRAEMMDMSVKMIEVDRRGKEGLICADNIRADINVTFFVRVNKTRDDVLKVAQSIGCARASDALAIRDLFGAKFSEALKTVGKHFKFEDLYKMREEFKDQIIKVIGRDLNGFILDDAAIDFLEQTPLSSLDPNNIMDAEGIKKITDLTVVQNVQTNELRQKEKMEMGSQNLNAAEALYRFEQRQAEAEAKKQKEISVSQSREQNEALRVSSEEQKLTELVRQKNQEETLVAAEAAHRGVQVAQQNREREVQVEMVRVQQAKQIAERDVVLALIEKDKDVEVKKKEIADVIRERITVDKTVATEEEAIKDVRAISQAKRDKESIRIAAEGRAADISVTKVKAAEANEEAAKYDARQRIVQADAELETADRIARAKIRVAEGLQAELAAQGLAEARVKEALTIAAEKQGLMEARVALEKSQASATGEEKQGMARAKVKEADGAATAVVEERQGVARAKAKEADAQATEVHGKAEANALREKLFAEAAGIAEKATSMKALDEVSRSHEEFRLRLDKEKTVELEQIRMRRDMAASQAEVMGKAFANAKIQIMGGDGAFFDRFVRAVSLGQSVEGALEQSDTLKNLLAEATRGGEAGSSSLSSLVNTLGKDEGTRQKLAELLTRPTKK
jgi:uncharacterized membrane protein YqiK